MNAKTIEAARRGDRDARAAILRELQDAWFRLCMSLLGDAEFARDATQETAYRFLRDLIHFRGDSQLRTWSMGIAINVAREMRRSQAKISKLDPRTTIAAGPRPASPPDADAELNEQCSHLREFLEDLPERQREVIALRYFEDLPVQETAEAMQCAPGTVKATLHQALRALRLKMKQPI